MKHLTKKLPRYCQDRVADAAAEAVVVALAAMMTLAVPTILMAVADVVADNRFDYWFNLIILTSFSLIQ